MKPLRKRIPVILLTGFLGAGKTTLLQQMLLYVKDKRVLVIENELGEINIDRLLVGERNGLDVIELSNGCICCSLNNDLHKVIQTIILAQTPLDYLFIEATGVANPADIISVFLGERVTKYFEIDNVIGIMDASSPMQELFYREQVVLASTVLINKIDLVDRESVFTLKEWINEVNSEVVVFESHYGQVDISQLVGRYMFHWKQSNPFSTLRIAVPSQPHNAIQSVSYSTGATVTKRLFLFWLSHFLDFNKESVLRVKGVLYFVDESSPFFLQGVKDKYILNAMPQQQEKQSKVVFIGYNMETLAISSALDALFGHQAEGN